MTTKIRCFTVFDITKTNVSSRRPPSDSTPENLRIWQQKRDTQCNFDTVIQLVSLRAQPEDISEPKKLNTDSTPFDKFGTEINKSSLDYWTFSFTINHAGVFDDGITPLGLLYSDCQGVPMIAESMKSTSFIDVTAEQKNIYFEIADNE